MRRERQLSLFGSNTVSLEDYKKLLLTGTRRKQIERKFMKDIIKSANALDLPAIHIEYFCGNKFYPTCSGAKNNPHPPVRAICPKCGKTVLAVCTNRINRGLAGQFDILGISWAIETKHKRNLGAEKAKNSSRQENIVPWYESFGVPHITANEGDNQEIWHFLQEQKIRKEMGKDIS